MLRPIATYSLIALFFILSGCGYNKQTSPTNWLKSQGLSATYANQLATATLCQNFGCDKRKTIQLNADELSMIRQHFLPKPSTAEEERQRLASAIALFEQLNGPKLRTSGDEAQNYTAFMSRSNQLDCVAESLNTTRYLLLLEEMKLLRFHRTGGNVHRGLFTLNAPHNSATIIQLENQQAYAVDAWFGANAEPAWVVPIETWLDGATPSF